MFAMLLAFPAIVSALFGYFGVRDYLLNNTSFFFESFAIAAEAIAAAKSTKGSLTGDAGKSGVASAAAPALQCNKSKVLAWTDERQSRNLS